MANNNVIQVIVQAVDQASAQIASTAKNIDAALRPLSNRIVTPFEKAQSAAKSLVNSLGPVGKILGGLSIGAGLVAGTRAMIDAADELQLLQGKLKIVTKSTSDLIYVQKALRNVAVETRSSYSGLVELYSRVARNAEALGTSQSQLVQITKTVSQAIQVSGSTANEAQFGIIQLSQALASGVLRGDELRSVMEQMPRLARAMADGMGISIGKLREMGAEGKLTADVVIKALQSQAGVIDSEFKKLPVTVGSATAVMNDSIKQMAGEFFIATGASQALAKSIQEFGKTLKETAPSVAQFGADLGQVAKNIYAVFSVPLKYLIAGFIQLAGAAMMAWGAMSFDKSLIDAGMKKIAEGGKLAAEAWGKAADSIRDAERVRNEATRKIAGDKRIADWQKRIEEGMGASGPKNARGNTKPKLITDIDEYMKKLDEKRSELETKIKKIQETISAVEKAPAGTLKGASVTVGQLRERLAALKKEYDSLGGEIKIDKNAKTGIEGIADKVAEDLKKAQDKLDGLDFLLTIPEPQLRAKGIDPAKIRAQREQIIKDIEKIKPGAALDAISNSIEAEIGRLVEKLEDIDFVLNLPPAKIKSLGVDTASLNELREKIRKQITDIKPVDGLVEIQITAKPAGTLVGRKAIDAEFETMLNGAKDVLTAYRRDMMSERERAKDDLRNSIAEIETQILITKKVYEDAVANGNAALAAQAAQLEGQLEETKQKVIQVGTSWIDMSDMIKGAMEEAGRATQNALMRMAEEGKFTAKSIGEAMKESLRAFISSLLSQQLLAVWKKLFDWLMNQFDLLTQKAGSSGSAIGTALGKIGEIIFGKKTTEQKPGTTGAATQPIQAGTATVTSTSSTVNATTANMTIPQAVINATQAVVNVTQGMMTITTAASIVIQQAASVVIHGNAITAIVKEIVATAAQCISNCTSCTGGADSMGLGSSDSGGGWQGIAMKAAMAYFGGGFAGGGVAPKGKWSVVGERGPEIIAPTQNTRVLPELPSGGGGGTLNFQPSYSINIVGAKDDKEMMAQMALYVERRDQQTKKDVQEMLRRNGFGRMR